MKYGRIEGPVYFRYARTAPVINSQMASQYGIEAALGIAPQQEMTIEEGRNVKLRMILDKRKTRMTCHARIDRVKNAPESGECRVCFSQLSLSDVEFEVLRKEFTEELSAELRFTDSVREAEDQAVPIMRGIGGEEIARDKAVSMPVRLIEAIDSERGDVPFSEYVVEALTARLSGK